ncbi:hypothetical protein [Halobacterium sp. CBA1126]|uniref:hypothetical protein n=1 Tax=Halobacterium sp. CBA1126 TaxID=2668074 RepID=UPI0012FA4C83|nr:hypothetical protein [Halobacterium sp. CBA1126]MUV60186.1 hypothetical protein [Halobacterium sp. CBA1126]
MTRFDIDLPDAWRRQPTADRRDSPTKLSYRASTGTTFIVTISADASDGGAYSLRLSTETPTNVRHDYLVDKYDSRRAVASAAESFVVHLTRQIEGDELSASDPSTDAVQRTIKSFRDESVLQSLRRTVDGLL